MCNTCKIRNVLVSSINTSCHPGSYLKLVYLCNNCQSNGHVLNEPYFFHFVDLYIIFCLYVSSHIKIKYKIVFSFCFHSAKILTCNFSVFWTILYLKVYNNNVMCLYLLAVYKKRFYITILNHVTRAYA